MATARERLIEDHRIARLTTDVDAWDQARRIRAYCDAAEPAYRDNAETNKWIAWARAHAQQLDPLVEPPAFPESPTPAPEALQPYLPDGWSAHGPPPPRPDWMFRADRSS